MTVIAQDSLGVIRYVNRKCDSCNNNRFKSSMGLNPDVKFTIPSLTICGDFDNDNDTIMPGHSCIVIASTHSQSQHMELTNSNIRCHKW